LFGWKEGDPTMGGLKGKPRQREDTLPGQVGEGPIEIVDFKSKVVKPRTSVDGRILPRIGEAVAGQFNGPFLEMEKGCLHCSFSILKGDCANPGAPDSKDLGKAIFCFLNTLHVKADMFHPRERQHGIFQTVHNTSIPPDTQKC
jgi:hypothetical protein